MGWTNKVSGRVDGSVVQVGVMLGDLHVNAAGPVRSAYSSQVRALAPDTLEGREKELAILSTFCTSASTAEDYLWWQAEAWSGKSALLSWFVTHPPPDVRIVSFFITSRLPGQNDRRGFVDNVLDQLHDIAGRPPRADLTDATREPHLLQLLAEVSEQIRGQDEHLALVVDGLDEDRGVDGSPDAHSIAALLPRCGVRVIVAGRPNPGLPDDVPLEHPLRTSTRVEHLPPSPKASAMREVMIRDLKRLLRGSQLQQDLLGFATAAGGGLSAQDLAELTGTSPWQVEDDLRTTAGRSFSRRPGTPPVYLLAHEQLHALASEMLGTRLSSYYERLNAWADAYRAREWPSETPRYLLQGYTSTLIAIGDVSRLLDHVTDPRRHEAAYSTFGYHHASVGEIEAAQAMLLGEDSPDLAALARLAVHRAHLREGGEWIPRSLPQVWAIAGRAEYAESLIMMMNNPVWRARALIATALESHRNGQAGRASRLLDAAEVMTRAVNQYWGPWLHCELADAATRIGDYNRARRVIDDVEGASSKARVYALTALAALDVSAREQAAQWYLDAEDAFEHRSAGQKLLGVNDDRLAPIVFATMAAAAIALGNPTRAAELACLVNDPGQAFELGHRADVIEVVEMLTKGGFDDAAVSLTGILDSVEDREDALLHVTQVMAESSRLDEAEALARTAEESQHRYARLAAIAIAAGRNDPARAARLVAEIEATLEDIPAGGFRRFIVMATAVAIAGAGHCDRAESMVFSELLPCGHFGGALSVAVAFVRRDDSDRALRVIEATEQAARTTSPSGDELGLLRWIDVMTEFGDVDRAVSVADSVLDTEIRAAAWQRVAEGFAALGDLDRSVNALGRITRPSLQRRPRMEVIRALVARGDDAHAIDLARSASVAPHRAAALAFIAERTRHKNLLDETIELATSTEDVEEQAAILLSALRTAANMADRTTAENLLQRLNTIRKQLSNQTEHPSRPTLEVPHLPNRIDTLTEIVERVERFFDPDRSKERAPVVRHGAPPLWVGPSPLSRRNQYARSLTVVDWLDIVDRVVAVEPNVYFAILSELDKLRQNNVHGITNSESRTSRPSSQR